MAHALNDDGQPFAFGFNSHRRLERDISELLGLAKGMLADGVVSDAEIVLLHEWMLTHPEPVSHWPCDRIATRLQAVLADGIVDPEEQADLADLLAKLVGGNAGILADDNAATALPLDRPAPKLVFAQREYVLTGKFAYGTRTACERLVQDRGGSCEAGVTMHTDYLVIGTFGSRDWVHTSYGRKIEKAVDYRNRGAPVSIVCEQHWAAALIPEPSV